MTVDDAATVESTISTRLRPAADRKPSEHQLRPEDLSDTSSDDDDFDPAKEDADEEDTSDGDLVSDEEEEEEADVPPAPARKRTRI